VFSQDLDGRRRIDEEADDRLEATEQQRKEKPETTARARDHSGGQDAAWSGLTWAKWKH
jgi:hypothetical protein